MKSFFSLLIFLFFAAILPAQTVGQYELRKRGASGFTSYGITLTNGQVIGLTADVPAAITPFPGAFSALSGIPANSSGVLTNNGSGTLSYTATTTGGNGSADSGKLVAYDASGQLFATSAALVKHPGTAGLYAQLGWSSLSFAYPSGFTGELTPATLTASRTWMLPDATGTIITTGNLTSIITTGTITSGTWNGTAIGLGYIAQGGATSGQVLSWNGSAWAPAAGGGGLTIGTTTITSGTSGRVLYNNAGTVGELTTTGSGTVVALATSPTLVTPILGTPASGTLTNCTGLPASGVVGTAALLGTANVFSANSEASAPALYLTGAIYAAGTGTTNFPHLLIQPTGATAATGWSTSGTAFGINLNVDAGNFIDLRADGSQRFFVTASGIINLPVNDTATLVTSCGDIFSSVANGSFYRCKASTHYGIDTDATSTTDYFVWKHNEAAYAHSAANELMRLTEAGTLTVGQLATPTLTVSASSVTIGSGGTAMTTVKRASVTLVGGTATVSDTATTANSHIVVTVLTPGGTVGFLEVDLSAGASYTINSSSVLDTSTVTITAIHYP